MKKKDVASVTIAWAVLFSSCTSASTSDAGIEPVLNPDTSEVTQAHLDSIQREVAELHLHSSFPENPSESFEKLQSVFKGDYPEQSIRQFVIPLMHRYDIVINNENVMRIGNVVYTLSQSSKRGITEMRILESMFNMTDHSKKFSDDAAIVFTLLENNGH